MRAWSSVCLSVSVRVCVCVWWTARYASINTATPGDASRAKPPTHIYHSWSSFLLPFCRRRLNYVTLLLLLMMMMMMMLRHENQCSTKPTLSQLLTSSSSSLSTFCLKEAKKREINAIGGKTIPHVYTYLLTNSQSPMFSFWRDTVLVLWVMNCVLFKTDLPVWPCDEGLQYPGLHQWCRGGLDSAGGCRQTAFASIINQLSPLISISVYH